MRVVASAIHRIHGDVPPVPLLAGLNQERAVEGLLVMAMLSCGATESR